MVTSTRNTFENTIKRAQYPCMEDTAITQADSTQDASNKPESHAVLAGRLCIPQKGTAKRIAALQAHIASEPESKQRLEEAKKELSIVLAFSDLHNALTKSFARVKARSTVRETFERADSEDELPFA